MTHTYKMPGPYAPLSHEELAEAAVAQSLKAKPLTQPQIARMARRKKLLDKLRDADIHALLALCRAFTGDDEDGDVFDRLTDAVIEKMSEDATYVKFEMLCLEVLELRKRLRRLGMDSNWEPTNDE